MKLEQLTRALERANIPFTIKGTDRPELYIKDVLILCGDSTYVAPMDMGFFITEAAKSIPLEKLKSKDLKPMIAHYRKFYPALPEIPSEEA